MSAGSLLARIARILAGRERPRYRRRFPAHVRERLRRERKRRGFADREDVDGFAVRVGTAIIQPGIMPVEGRGGVAARNAETLTARKAPPLPWIASRTKRERRRRRDARR